MRLSSTSWNTGIFVFSSSQTSSLESSHTKPNVFFSLSNWSKCALSSLLRFSDSRIFWANVILSNFIY